MPSPASSPRPTTTPALDAPVGGAAGPAFLEVYRDGAVRLMPLSGQQVTIGRAPVNDLVVSSDESSRLHALLEPFAAGWTIRDLGSTNGTTVNGAPLADCRILRDGDVVQIATARIVFRAGDGSDLNRTTESAEPSVLPALTPREQDVIAALCRPFLDGALLVAEAPSVRRLAGDLSLSPSAVKKHLANLYDKFGLTTADERRRHRLASEALRRGALRRP